MFPLGLNMLKPLGLSILPIAFASSTLAGNVTKIECQPVDKPNGLFADGNHNLTRFGFSQHEKTGEFYNLVALNSTQQTFQFYECTFPDAPTSQGEKYGQVRSMSQKDHCVTTGDTVTLQPCESTLNENFRKQGFFWQVWNLNCADLHPIAHEAGSYAENTLTGDKHSSQFSYQYKNYLSPKAYIGTKHC